MGDQLDLYNLPDLMGQAYSEETLRGQVALRFKWARDGIRRAREGDRDRWLQHARDMRESAKAWRARLRRLVDVK